MVGIVGAGSVGTALGVALERAGWPVGAVASRDPARRERFRSLVSGVRAFAEPEALIDDVELVMLAVPDDVVVPLAGSLRLYAGQAIVHTSGLLGAEVLAPALGAGSQAGAFHPLVAFADLDRALAALPGATIAIEGDEDLAGHLADMAEAIGACRCGSPRAPRPPTTRRPCWRRAASSRCSTSSGRSRPRAGMDEAGALRIYLPLVRQTLANAEALGVARSLTGPRPAATPGP